MMLLSITGTVRMILILVAVFVIVRFIGRILIANRNSKEERDFNQNNSRYQQEKQRSEEEKGKVEVVDRYRDAEDVDFKEVED
jgi:flagellar biosynthesis/type III secretory pathway M-ring protein FliF/YscJ